jgi:hypothetical protein
MMWNVGRKERPVSSGFGFQRWRYDTMRLSCGKTEQILKTR